jgi:hypothetical protein
MTLGTPPAAVAVGVVVLAMAPVSVEVAAEQSEALPA